MKVLAPMILFKGWFGRIGEDVPGISPRKKNGKINGFMIYLEEMKINIKIHHA